MDACRQVLAGEREPVIAYVPAAAEERHFVRETRASFRGIAEVRAVKAEVHTPAQMRSALDRASLVYIPGGNTYLAAKRLHASGLMDDLRRRIIGGLPLAAFSAGTVLCGVDILTSNNTNDYGCTDFTGLGLLGYNFNVHYQAEEGEERRARDARLQAYADGNKRPVLALQDGAYILVKDGSVELVEGTAWFFRPGTEVKQHIGKGSLPK